MSLVRFDLARELDDLRNEVNSIFTNMPISRMMSPMVGLGNGLSTMMNRWYPAMDTVHENGKLLVTLDLPGLDEKDIDVEVLDNMLTIRGRRMIDREKGDANWHRFERVSGEFERCIQLPDNIDAGKVKASFDKGVLTVTVPVPKASISEARHVAITSGSKPTK